MDGLFSFCFIASRLPLIAEQRGQKLRQKIQENCRNDLPKLTNYIKYTFQFLINIQSVFFG